ncbi:hypothetical protein [Dactylosporangium sp. NPDC005555]
MRETVEVSRGGHSHDPERSVVMMYWGDGMGAWGMAHLTVVLDGQPPSSW